MPKIVATILGVLFGLWLGLSQAHAASSQARAGVRPLHLPGIDTLSLVSSQGSIWSLGASRAGVLHLYVVAARRGAKRVTTEGRPIGLISGYPLSAIVVESERGLLVRPLLTNGLGPPIASVPHQCFLNLPNSLMTRDRVYLACTHLGVISMTGTATRTVLTSRKELTIVGVSGAIWAIERGNRRTRFVPLDSRAARPFALEPGTKLVADTFQGARGWLLVTSGVRESLLVINLRRGGAPVTHRLRRAADSFYSHVAVVGAQVWVVDALRQQIERLGIRTLRTRGVIQFVPRKTGRTGVLSVIGTPKRGGVLLTLPTSSTSFVFIFSGRLQRHRLIVRF
jgi:hypothetical protein